MLTNLPAWIQALAAVGIVILTVLTLIVLKGYAADTKTIANASLAQTENAQIPFLAPASLLGAGGVFAGWVIENQGFGPAINVKWARIQSGTDARFTPSIASGTKTTLDTAFDRAIGEHAEVQIDYESLSGLRYGTVIKWDGVMIRTQFHDFQRGKS